HLLADLDEVAVALLPVVDQGEGVFDLVDRGHGEAGHGAGYSPARPRNKARRPPRPQARRRGGSGARSGAWPTGAWWPPRGTCRSAGVRVSCAVGAAAPISSRCAVPVTMPTPRAQVSAWSSR